jgi:hypothetical protein
MSLIIDAEQGAYPSYQSIPPTASAAIDVTTIGDPDENLPVATAALIAKPAQATLIPGHFRPPPSQAAVIANEQRESVAYMHLCYRARLLVYVITLGLLMGAFPSSDISRDYTTWPVIEGIPVPEVAAAAAFRHAFGVQGKQTIGLTECIQICGNLGLTLGSATKYGVHYEGGVYQNDVCLCFTNPGFECLWDDMAWLRVLVSSVNQSATTLANQTSSSSPGPDSSFHQRLEHGTVFSKYAMPPPCGMYHFCNSPDGAQSCWHYLGPDSALPDREHR